MYGLYFDETSESPIEKRDKESKLAEKTEDGIES